MSRTWSPQQEAIFDWFKNGTGNLVIRARAGTGKTTTILEGISHAWESKILLAAFNKTIAEELKTRLKNPRAAAKTLHSIGFEFVRKSWPNVKVDADRGERLVKDAIHELCPWVDDSPITPRTIGAIKKLVSLSKSVCPSASIEELVELAIERDCMPEPNLKLYGWTDDLFYEVAHNARERALKVEIDPYTDDEFYAIDFDDMLYVPVRNNWLYGTQNMVVIDEAQDMNATQIAIALGVAKKGGRIAVVGDDRQAIYGFRGADSGSLDRLKKELNAAELGLTITYRCPKSVVALAAELVPDFEAAPEAPDGLVSSVTQTKLLDVASPGDFILSRKNAPLASVCLGLLKRGKRAKIQGRDIGKGFVTLVRRLKSRSIPEFLESLRAYTNREVQRVRASNIKNKDTKIEYLHDQEDTLTSLTEGLSGPRELEARIEELFADVEKNVFVIICSSIHRAKGLEAHKVFLLEDTLYPGGRQCIEEENLEYVGITRTKHELVWVSSGTEAA